MRRRSEVRLPSEERFFFLGRFAFCFVLFCFVFFKHIFDRLKYTDRLIASPLPAFMSKIINPQVSNIGTL